MEGSKSPDGVGDQGLPGIGPVVPAGLDLTQYIAPDLSRLTSRWNFGLSDSILGSNEVNRLLGGNQQLSERMLRAFNNSLGESALARPEFYSAALLAALSGRPRAKPRRKRSPQDFFGVHEVEVKTVAQFLRATSKINEKHRRHSLVWRGQQDASWSVHSSLHRHLRDSRGVERVKEDHLVAGEVEAFGLAASWDHFGGSSVGLLASLQHAGAPTRLLDSTLDQDVAAWFAVEHSEQLDEVDAMVFSWGRVPLVRGKKVPDIVPIPDSAAYPFWHDWTTPELRRKKDWGTGTRLWSWFPPASSDRMRAQRAGFIFETEALLTSKVAEVFTESLGADWRADEISGATSVVGLPCRHDVMTKPNAANLVPMFALRISASMKPELREYLRNKGLEARTIYPDFPGLVSHLRSLTGPLARLESDDS